MERSSFVQSMLAYVLTPVTSTGQPITVNPVNGLPMLNYSPASTSTFAVVGPMSGPSSQIGQQLVNGARAAIDYANSRPGGKLDRGFALSIFDDQDQPIQSALSAGYATATSTVIGAIGHYSGINTDAALHTYVSARMPLIVPATTSDAVTSHGYQNIFRLPTRDAAEGTLTARYVRKTLNTKRCAVVTREGTYGNDVADAFFRDMESAHVVVNRIVVANGDTHAELSAARIIATNPDVVYFAGKISDLGQIFAQVADSAPSIRLSASQGFFSEHTTTDYAKAAEAMLVSTSIPPMNMIAQNRLIVSDFIAKYGSFTTVAGFAYAAAQILISAARRSGATNRVSLTSALSDGTTYTTIAGDFRFTPFGDQVDPNLYFYTVRNKAWHYVESYRPAPFAIDKGA